MNGAQLNLASYAYGPEVRLAARMVLDYVAARYAVSSNDLRRMVPFRRRNEGKHVERLDTLLYPDVTFEDFKAGVRRHNPGFLIRNWCS